MIKAEHDPAVIYMRTKLFARCKCRKIIEVIIVGFKGRCSFRVYGECPFCHRKINRLAFKFQNILQRSD